MSTDLLRKLRSLEDDYFSQPVFVRKADLEEINQLRVQLGMPLVDFSLKVIGSAVETNVVETAAPILEAVPDHSRAREIYGAYLKKIEQLEACRAYAAKVATSTAGHGQTPVRPLATMGNNGGPLLCDHCGKPIVLEGGRFQGITADVAWKQNPSDGWTSWILGGMVVEIQTNGTLRIYHGYPGRNDQHCCNVASRQDEVVRAEFKSRKDPETTKLLLAFLEHEFPDKTGEEREDLLDNIRQTMFAYDPGLGVNRPSEE